MSDNIAPAGTSEHMLTPGWLAGWLRQHQYTYFTDICSDSEAGSYVRLIDSQMLTSWLPWAPWQTNFVFFLFFTLVTGPRRSSSLEMSDTRVYEPQIRALLADERPEAARPQLPPEVRSCRASPCQGDLALNRKGLVA